MKQLTNFSYGKDKVDTLLSQFGQDAPIVVTLPKRSPEEVAELLEKSEAICDELEKGGAGSGPHKQLGDQAYREATKVGVKLSQKNGLIKQAEKHYNDHAESLNHKELMTAHDNSTPGSLHQKVLATHIHQRANEMMQKQHDTQQKEGKVPHSYDISHAKQILSRNANEPREPKVEKSIDDEINDALDDILSKGGEGSKGGKVLGHTKSGKPIYANKKGDDKIYSNYSVEDHEDAAEAHGKEKQYFQSKLSDSDFARAGTSGSSKPAGMVKRDYHDQRRVEHGFEVSRLKKVHKSFEDELNDAFDNILCKAHTGKLDTSHLVLKDVYVTGRGTQKRWVDPHKGDAEFAPHGSEVTFKQSGKDMKGVVGDTKYLSKPNTHLYEVHGEDGKTYTKFAHHISEVHGKADKGAYGLTRGTKKPVIGEDPKAKADEPKGSFYHDINKRFQVYEDLADEVINGHSIRSLLVYGSGGVGKSYTVGKLLKDSKKKPYKNEETTPKGSDTYDHVVLKGGSLTTAGLYKALWEHNGKLIILDDNDSVLKDDNAINMLKGALDTKDRRVSKGSARPIKDSDGQDIPDTFPFRGKFIFITNLDVNEPSLQPLKTRSSKIDMTMSPDQTIDRIEEIGKDKKSGKLTGFDFADDEGESGDFKYTDADARYVMDFMRKRKYDFGDDLSIRTVKTLLTLKKRAERRGIDPADYMETHILSKGNDDELNNAFNRLIA